MNGIASKLGLATASLHELLAGQVPNDAASNLKTSTAALQDFIDGRVAAGFASLLGGPPEDVQRLRDQIGREGAIGVIIGLLAEPD